MTTAIFYASSTGNTENISEIIAKELKIKNSFEISSKNIKEIEKYDKLIFGVSTWGDGDLQDDWEDLFDEFCEIDFSNKTVALFGLGDQLDYPDTFMDAMGILYEQIIKANGKVIGFWDKIDEYTFDESKALIDNKFVGLALDEDNQEELTQDRIKSWISLIKNQIL